MTVSGEDRSGAGVDLERWTALAEATLSAERVAGDVGLHFVDEAEIEALNEEHLGHEGPTDVLSFPIDGRDAGPEGLVGDVVVCPAVARRNAAEQGRVGDDEVALLVVHGVLHLLGMDHAEAGEAAEMEAREQQHLKAFHR